MYFSEAKNEVHIKALPAGMILDCCPFLFFELDSNAVIKRINRQAAEIVQKNENMIINRKIWEILPQTLNNKLRREYEEIYRKKEIQVWETLILTCGKWYEVKAYPFEGMLLLFYYDITDRKAAEERLRLKHDVFNLFPVGAVIVSSPGFVIEDVNTEFLNMTGLAKEKLLGLTLDGAEIGLCVKDSAIPVSSLLSGREDLRNREVVCCGRDGEKRTWYIASRQIPSGRRPLLLVLFFDSRFVREGDNDKLSGKQIVQAGQIASRMAHELRNPMTTISGILQLLGRREESDKYREFINLILAEWNRINDFIDQYLFFDSKSLTNAKYQKLENIVLSVYPLLQSHAAETGKKVVLELEETTAVFLDEYEIQQLIIQLVRNGLEAMKEEGKVTVRTFMKGNTSVLAVKDEGGGIAAELGDRIGTPFFTTKKKGAGLGLAICYYVAYKHKAKLEFESGQSGTVFYLCFETSDTER